MFSLRASRACSPLHWKHSRWELLAASSSWEKFVSCAVYREQMPGICGVRLQLLTQLQNLIVHGSRGWIRIVPQTSFNRTSRVRPVRHFQ